MSEMTTDDYSREYGEAVRLMGLRGTDLAALARACAYLWLRAPAPYAAGFAALMEQIERRRLVISLAPHGLRPGAAPR
ncbi:MAG TPA: hypothetical protein VD838_01395 [Anaeromyxobacteraceae bacterium]|nr:hypothetical protein [Anaeromyxobacteraceae bacterium]